MKGVILSLENFGTSIQFKPYLVMGGADISESHLENESLIFNAFSQVFYLLILLVRDLV